MTTTLAAPLPGSIAPDAAGERSRPWIAPAVHAALIAGLLWATPEDSFGPSWLTLSRVSVDASQLVAVGGGAALAGVLLARRHPWGATLLPLTPILLSSLWPGSTVWAWFAAVVSIASIAALDGVRRALVPTAAAVGLALVYCGTTVPALLPIGEVTAGNQTPEGMSATSWLGLDSRTTSVFVAYVVGILAVVGVSWAAGAVRRARAARNVAEQTEQRALVLETAAAERSRLARDLHDVVAHHVSLVAVRAESAPYQYPNLDAEARTVLAAIADDARAALGELRQVLTVLQRTEDAAAGRAPQPGAAEVEALVADARSAGQVVQTVGVWTDVPAAQGYALYRAVQEGLSNARRHAPGAPVRFERRQTDDGVGFALANPTRQVGEGGAPGRGLLGMRERVEALGGAMAADRTDGAFVLDVELPVVQP